MMEILSRLATGIPLTVAVTAGALVIGLLLSIPWVIALRSSSRIARGFVNAVIDILRGIPILVWLFILYFGISIGTFTFQPLTAAIITLGVVASAYLAEVFRTALAAVPRHQWQSAEALGLNRADTYLRVILPQAASIALPSATTFTLALLKDSAIPSVIGVSEIAYVTTEIAREGTALPAYVSAVILYVILSLPLALLARYASARLNERMVAV